MIIQNAKEESRDWFNRIDNMLKEDPNIKLSTKVILTGVSIYGEIIQYAEKENIDLIVIGTRGRSGVKKLLLGSTASAVVTYVKTVLDYRPNNRLEIYKFHLIISSINKLFITVKIFF